MITKKMIKKKLFRMLILQHITRLLKLMKITKINNSYSK